MKSPNHFPSDYTILHFYWECLRNLVALFAGQSLVLAILIDAWACLVAPMVKHLPAVQETRVPSLDWEDPLEKGMATLSSILAWKIPWTEPGGYSPRSHKELDMIE